MFALVGNWVLELYDDAWTDEMFKLDEVLKSVGLRSHDDTPNTVFSQIVNLFRRITNPKSADVTMTLTPDGLQSLCPGSNSEMPGRLRTNWCDTMTL